MDLLRRKDRTAVIRIELASYTVAGIAGYSKSKLELNAQIQRRLAEETGFNYALC